MISRLFGARGIRWGIPAGWVGDRPRRLAQKEGTDENDPMSTPMTGRERILSAIEFRGPDRCPIEHYVFPGAFRRHGRKLLDLLDRYPDDFENEAPLRNAAAAPTAEEDPNEIVEWTDAWGTVWRRLKGYTSGEVHRPAIPSWDVWKRYEFPPKPSDREFRDFADMVRARHPDRFVKVSGGGFFQHMQHLRGPANYFIDLAEDNEGVHELAERMVERNLYSIRRYIEAGVDCIAFGDDWGGQSSLLIHPDSWRRFFKPRYARMFEPIRNADIHVWFHSDGWILDIIEDLIEIGVTVLNPQHSCMGNEAVTAVAGGRICIRTDIDRQWTIPFGSPEEITEAVRYAVASFGRFDGGVILHGEIGPEVPFENIEALYSAFYRYGRYPLEWM